MNEERLRQLYGQGIAGRDARSELVGACAVEPERLLALVRNELPEAERLELLDQVMSSRACREAFELLRVVEAAGRETGGRPSLLSPRRQGGHGGPEEYAPGRAGGAEEAASAPAPEPVLPSSALPSSALPSSVLPSSMRPAPDAGHGARGPGHEPAAPAVASVRPLRAPWWRGGGAAVALAASALLAVGLLARQYGGDRPEPFRGGDAVALVAPATELAQGSGAPRFVWHAVPGAVRYEFELVDDRGELVHGATTAAGDTVVALPDGVALQPGTEYRWLVRAVTAAGAQSTSPARPLVLLRAR